MRTPLNYQKKKPKKTYLVRVLIKKKKRNVEVWGFEPQTFRMRSEHSTPELYPHNKAVLDRPEI